MKHLCLFLLCLPQFCQSQTITFFTEDFGFGCNDGQLATDYFSFTNGAWTISETGFNGNAANNWFVSGSEAGFQPGECGGGCILDFTLDNQTLHIGPQLEFGSDGGAAYYECGGFCELFGFGETSKRIESGFINFSSFSTNSISFNYIEAGNDLDNATLWYNDGSGWIELADMPKTLCCGELPCNGTLQGIWNSFTTDLPVSSNGNPNVQIGFQWVNNEDGIATDPSFAVDDITITGDFAEDIVPPIVVCPMDWTVTTNEFCGILGDYTGDAAIFDDVDPFPVVVQDPEIGTEIVGTVPITITATDNSGNSTSCFFLLTVIDDDAPTIICPPNQALMISSEDTFGPAIVPLPLAEDNCGNVSFSNSFNLLDDASDNYPLGITEVLYTAMDESGNMAECSFSVNVSVADEDCCIGDFDCDHYVSVLDLLALISEFGCTSNCTTDLDDDSVVGVGDMQIFMSVYNNCP